MIIQAELKRKQSEYEGEPCSVDKVIELPAQRFRTMISLQRTKPPSGRIRIHDTACSSLMQVEQMAFLLTRKGTTTPGTAHLFRMPAVC